MAATKIVKGVECFRFVDWNHAGACAYRRVIVESWGRKQATVRFTEDGKMAEERVYVEHQAGEFVPVADCTDPAAEAMTRAHALVAKWDAHYAECLSEPTRTPGYHDLMRAERAALTARVVNLDNAAERAAEHALTLAKRQARWGK